MAEKLTMAKKITTSKTNNGAVLGFEAKLRLVEQPLKTELKYHIIAINKSGEGSPSNMVMVVL